VKIEKRNESLRIVRGMNKVPGVLFGKTITPISIQIDEKDLHQLVNEFGYTKTFKVKLGKETHQVYIKEIQYDIMNHNHFLNVKMLKLVAGDTIKASLPLNILGREAIDKPGIIIQIMSDSIDVEYPIDKVVENIDIDISKMVVGDSLHVKDLKLPDYLILHDDLDKMLLSVSEVTYVEEKDEDEEEIEVTETENVENTEE